MVNKKIISELAVGIVLLVALAVGGIFWLQDKKETPSVSSASEVNNQDQLGDKKDNNQAIQNVPVGWKAYRHEILGIEFIYPESWGKPKTEPRSAITKLDGIADEFDREENANYDSVTIRFAGEDNSSLNFDVPSIRIFGNKYRGEHYPNLQAYEYGYVDNIESLKKSGNICDYKINFETEYKSTLTEIKNSCKDNVKEAIIRDKKFFGEWSDEDGTSEEWYLYSYDVKQLGFVKLQNGFFDNVLAMQVLGDTPQMEDTADQNVIYSKLKTGLLNNKIVNEEDLALRRKEFSEFISSIHSFAPEIPVQKAFENISGEDSNITKIRKFYWLISSGDLKNAYGMYANKSGVPFEKFNGWYKNVFFAKPVDFKKTGDKQYEFIVRYQEQNSESTKYRVVMKIEDEKVHTISSVEILTAEVSFGDMKAYAIRRDDKNYVILEKNGKEEIIDQGDAEYIKDEKGEYENLGNVKYFYNIRFSPKGNYLIYMMGGYEWSFSYVYDIAKKENVFNESAPSFFDFSPNEENLLVCTSSGMDSVASGIVYSVSDFKAKFNVLNGIADGSYSSVICKQGTDDTIEFVLNNNNWEGVGKEDKPESKIIIYSLSQNKVIE